MIVLVREEDVFGTVEETQLAERKLFEVTEKHEQLVTEKKKLPAKKPPAKSKAR
jgi:hypothetical protein